MKPKPNLQYIKFKAPQQNHRAAELREVTVNYKGSKRAVNANPNSSP